MPHDRFFTAQQLTIGTEVALSEDEGYHLARIMRVAVGETIEVVNGQGWLAQATVEAIQKRTVTLRIVNIHQDPPPRREIILAQALPKVNRLDTIIEKGTEIGATQIWLFPGQRSEKRDLSPNQLQRVHALTISALKQCGRLYLPKIEIKPVLEKWTELPCKGFFGHTSDDAPTFQQLWQQEKPKDIIFFVGPEAGFTPHEIRILKRLEATGVCLHNNILRTDTASIVALSLISHWMM